MSTLPARAHGVLFILCGPSGVGKSTLGRELRSRRPDVTLSVSCTTRPPRPGERDGVDYSFMSRDEFHAMREQGGFAEFAEVHGNFYGTPRYEIARAFKSGLDLFFDIDYQGAIQLQEAYPEACCSVLVAPPSMSELEGRLRGRGTDSDEVIERRLRAARGELEQFAVFDHIIVNDDLARAQDDVVSIYDAARFKRTAQRPRLEKILAGS